MIFWQKWVKKQLIGTWNNDHIYYIVLDCSYQVHI